MNDVEKKAANLKAVIRYRATTKGQIVFRKALCRYRQTEKGKAGQRYFQRIYQLANPEKVRTRSALSYAVKTGKLPKPNTFQCVFCPEQAQQYHHHNGYAPKHRFDVVPVCLKCHKE